MLGNNEKVEWELVENFECVVDFIKKNNLFLLRYRGL